MQTLFGSTDTLLHDQIRKIGKAIIFISRNTKVWDKEIKMFIEQQQQQQDEGGREKEREIWSPGGLPSIRIIKLSW